MATPESQNGGLSLADHYRLWSGQKSDELIAACKEIQEEMFREIVPQTPIRIYSTNTQVVRHITANRFGGRAAVKVVAPAKLQTGVTRTGWIKAEVMLGGNRVFAVRNTKRPTTIHLINFTHDHYSHKIKTGDTRGTMFVTRTQEKGMDKLMRKIPEIMEREE